MMFLLRSSKFNVKIIVNINARKITLLKNKHFTLFGRQFLHKIVHIHTIDVSDGNHEWNVSFKNVKCQIYFSFSSDALWLHNYRITEHHNTVEVEKIRLFYNPFRVIVTSIQSHFTVFLSPSFIIRQFIH